MNLFKLIDTASNIYRSVTGRSAFRDALQTAADKMPAQNTQKVSPKPKTSKKGVGKTNLEDLKTAVYGIERDGEITTTEVLFLHKVISGLGLSEAEYKELVVDNLMKRFSQMILEDDKVSKSELQAYKTFGEVFGLNTLQGGKFKDDYDIRLRMVRSNYKDSNLRTVELPEAPSHILSDEDLEDLPTFRNLEEALENPEKVIKLDLTRIPFEYNMADRAIERFQNLQVLKLIKTGIERIMFDVAKLKKLTHLDLSKNPDLEFEPTLNQLQHCQYLRELGLSEINLVNLPKNLSTLQYLEMLDLSHNLFMTLDKHFRNSPSLWYLDLSYNENLDFDALISAFQHRVSPEKLQIDLSNCNLGHIPQELRFIKSIEELNLSNNQIMTFPDMFEQMEGLETLILNENPFMLEEIETFRQKMPNTTILFDNLEMLKERMNG